MTEITYLKAAIENIELLLTVLNADYSPNDIAEYNSLHDDLRWHEQQLVAAGRSRWTN